MKANDLSRFTFERICGGHYRVIYTTDRGDYYVATITDMTLIDATKNAEYAKLCNIRHLRSVVVRVGTHYHKDGTRFND